MQQKKVRLDNDVPIRKNSDSSLVIYLTTDKWRNAYWWLKIG